MSAPTRFTAASAQKAFSAKIRRIVQQPLFGIQGSFRPSGARLFQNFRPAATISNCSNNYGPYQFPEKLIPLIILNALEGKQLPVYGDGKNIRDWLYVEDHCEAIWTIMTSGRIGETYNVGGKAEMQNIIIVQMICDILDEIRPATDRKSRRQLITFVKDRPGHDRRYAIDFAKIKEELAWMPKESFNQV